MAYVQNWLHCVWGTKNRLPFITSQNKIEIIAHIRENAKVKGIYIDFINGHKEHIHCIISLSADQTLTKVMQLIKGESSFWINKHSISQGKFEWADELSPVPTNYRDRDDLMNEVNNTSQYP
jgi:REP element-mobilizing transposase RayT